MGIIQNISTRLPVQLSLAGVDVTGMLPADILNGVAQVIKSDGSKASIALINNTNWFELDSMQSPGLYHLVVPSGAVNLLGVFQYTVYPDTNSFDSFVGATEVIADPATAAGIAALTGVINGSVTTAQNAINMHTTSKITEIAGTDFDGMTDTLHKVVLAITNAITVINSSIVGSTNSIKGISNLSITQLSNQLTSNATAIANAVWEEPRSGHLTAGTFGEFVRIANLVFTGRLKIDRATNRLLVYSEDTLTLYKSYDLKDVNGMPTYLNPTERLAGV